MICVCVCVCVCILIDRVSLHLCDVCIDVMYVCKQS
jgi:hypothetical protein